MEKDPQLAAHDAVIDAHVDVFKDPGSLFDWGRVVPSEVGMAVETLTSARLSITFTSYLEGRTVSVRVHDRDGSTVWHIVSGDELRRLMLALAGPQGPDKARSLFTPHPRGGRRR